MLEDSTRRFGDSNAAQQLFLSLFLRSEQEIFRYVAALVPNATDAEDIVQQTALALWEKFNAYDPALPFTPWACRFDLNKTHQWIERSQRSLVEGYYYERTGVETLAERSGRSPAVTYKMLQRIRHTLQLCVESQAKPEVALTPANGPQGQLCPQTPSIPGAGRATPDRNRGWTNQHRTTTINQRLRLLGLPRAVCEVRSNSAPINPTQKQFSITGASLKMEIPISKPRQ